jgi:divalent metal cation (Fe/Co/Zn/Cd) transporter
MGPSARSERSPSLLALISLALYHPLGWWWADRIAALAVAAVAAAEAWHTAPRRIGSR